MNTESLINIINKFKGKKALVVGDIMVDRYIIGTASRLSDEAPVPIVRVKSSDERLGGASNTAANLANLGVEVFFAGIIGSDLEGRIVKDLLEEKNINTDGLITDRSRPTILKTRVLARNQQTLRIDWEDTTPISGRVEDELLEYFTKKINEVDFVIISDYGKGTLTEKLFKLIAKLSKEKFFSIKKCPIIIDPSPVNYEFYDGFTVCKPNRREAEDATKVSITSISSAKEVASKIRSKWNTEIVVLSLGEDGLLISSEQSEFSIPTVAKSVYDVSGAGDTVTAVFSAALSVGASLEDCALLANISAGIVVEEVGTVAISLNKLLPKIQEGSLELAN